MWKKERKKSKEGCARVLPLQKSNQIKDDDGEGKSQVEFEPETLDPQLPVKIRVCAMK